MSDLFLSDLESRLLIKNDFELLILDFFILADLCHGIILYSWRLDLK